MVNTILLLLAVAAFYLFALRYFGPFQTLEAEMKAVERRLGWLQVGDLSRFLFLEIVSCNFLNNLLFEALCEASITGYFLVANISFMR